MKINFVGEGTNDEFNPINVACALINHTTSYDEKTFNKEQLRQIAEHLLVYCNHNLEELEK